MSQTITKPEENDQMAAYTEAVSSGLYAKRSGLVGKYDNVRRYWEDEVTRLQLRPFISRLIARARRNMHRVRVLDLGCGSADGYELLTGVRHREPGLEQTQVDLLTPNVLGLYMGVDLNCDLIDQARGIYGDSPKLQFSIADFNHGLPLKDSEKPFDLYFTSYGTCSHHNDDETMIAMLADIARHVDDYGVVVCDWLGRYSYEWQSLWTDDHQSLRNMDYVVSYIYEKEERLARQDELQHLCLRLMSRPEAEWIISEASQRAGVAIKPLKFFDRSIFTGRHMDTGDYNPHAQPMRQAVNSLHEANVRTALQEVLIDYVPRPGFESLNDYYERLQMCWNTLVLYTDELLHSYDPSHRCFSEELSAIPDAYPTALKEAMEKMRCVVQGVGWLDAGLPRENIIEPQLGYALRWLMMNMQQGIGGGHGLVGVLQIDKSGQCGNGG